MKFSTCTEMVFSGMPIQSSLPLVKASGCGAFEFWTWANKDLDALEKAMSETGLKLAAFGQKRASLVDPAERDLFLTNLNETIAVAHRLGCKTLIVTVGDELPGRTRQEQAASIVEGMKRSAPVLEKEGITAVVEPLNILVNHKGYYLARSEEAFDIINKVGSPNVKVLFDIYHQQITEGNLIANITANIGLIGHFHVADVPGRNDPGSGEINYFKVFEAIDKTGYSGYTGLEYRPLGDKAESLKAFYLRYSL